MLALSACAGLPMQPPDPAVTARIVQACVRSGLFKAADGALAMAVPAVSLPVSAINAGVDIVCRDPARFAADVSTVEWVAKNLADIMRSRQSGGPAQTVLAGRLVSGQ